MSWQPVRLIHVLSLCIALSVGGCELFGGRGTIDPNTTFSIDGQSFRLETVVSGLEVPWDIGFSPDGALMFVTERPGRLRVINLTDGSIRDTFEINSLSIPFTEMGLMGLAVSPQFESDSTIYLGFTTGNSNSFKNVIERYLYSAGSLERIGDAPIVDEIPAAFIHDGMRLGFSPDGKLFASTGDAGEPSSARDPATRSGKFLRMNPDGSVPSDNPDPTSLVWSRGHRNPQGFDWHPQRPTVMLGLEHGSNAGDELNLIVPGGDYGWPEFTRDQSGDGITVPLVQSGDETFAPSGGVFCNGVRYPAWTNAFLFVGLRGESLWVVRLSDDASPTATKVTRGLEGTLGRLRAVRQGPDGYIYVSTSNRDGRGNAGAGDDRVMRLVPIGG